MNAYGYIRTSEKVPDWSSNVNAIRTFGIDEKNIYEDMQSEKTNNNPAYNRLISLLKKGDLVVFNSIGELGKNCNDILKQWNLIIKEKGADIVILDMPAIDTRRYRDLVGSLVSDVVSQLLSCVVQSKQEFIIHRQAKGIAAAKARGVLFGRAVSKCQRPERYKECAYEWETGELSLRKAGVILGVSHTTFMKWLREDGICRKVNK